MFFTDLKFANHVLQRDNLPIYALGYANSIGGMDIEHGGEIAAGLEGAVALWKYGHKMISGKELPEEIIPIFATLGVDAMLGRDNIFERILGSGAGKIAGSGFSSLVHDLTGSVSHTAMQAATHSHVPDISGHVVQDGLQSAINGLRGVVGNVTTVAEGSLPQSAPLLENAAKALIQRAIGT